MARRPGILLGVMAALLSAWMLRLTGSAWPMLLYRLLIDGSLAVVWVLSAAGWGAWLTRAMVGSGQWAVDGERSGVLRWATAAGLGLGFFSLVFLALGLLGWLDQLSAAIALGIGVIALLERQRHALLAFSRRRTSAGPGQLSTGFHWLWLLVVPPGAVALVGASIPPGILWGGEPNGYDVVEYHLQAPRQWYDAGRIVPLQHNVYSYMPFNVEMHYLAAMHLRGGPWAGMYLAQYLHVLFVGTSIVAIYGVVAARRGPAAGVLAGVVAAVTPWSALLAPIAYNEGGLLLWGALSMGWTWRALEQRTWRAWALAGLFAGLACGVKLTAVPLLLLALPAAALAASKASGRDRPAEGETGRHGEVRGRPSLVSLSPCLFVFLLVGSLTFAPWLVRNWAWTGNPVFPEAMNVLGSAHFTPPQVQRWEQAHAPRPDQQSLVGRLRAGWEQIVADAGFGYVLLPGGLAIAGLCLAQQRSPGAVLLLTLLVIQALIWLFFTHLQGRFFVLSIPLLALLWREVPWRRSFIAPALALIILSAILGAVHLHALLAPRWHAELLGLESYAWYFPDEVQEAIVARRSIGLVGAQAFLYQVPSSRLHYRTVFDVAARPGQDLVAAWLNDQSPEVIVIDPAEMMRLTNTYPGLPPPPPEWQSLQEPFIWKK